MVNKSLKFLGGGKTYFFRQKKLIIKILNGIQISGNSWNNSHLETEELEQLSKIQKTKFSAETK